jgi:hypothetical protein
MSTDKAVLQAQKQLIKDSIVDTASRLVKDTEDGTAARGMIEVGERWIRQLDAKLLELDRIERQIATAD